MIKRELEIEIFQLSNSLHEFEFSVDDTYFKAFDTELIQIGHADIHVNLDKSERLINMEFHIEGEVELTCDRSLDNFAYPIDITEKMIFKFGDHPGEISEELELISRDTLRINISQYIYEFICLAIPMKKLHPRFDQQSNSSESENYLIYSDQKVGENSEDELDPRWEVLKKLKKKNN